MIDDKKLQSKLNVPEYADLMTIEEFKEDCDNGLLIDYDGCGNFVSAKTGNTDIPVSPSDTANWTKENMPDYEYIAWYNK
mgnify:CR=1 FL=1